MRAFSFCLMLSLTLGLTLGGGCSTTALPSGTPGDGGAGHDLATTHKTTPDLSVTTLVDLATETCPQAESQFNAWIADHQQCVTDNDCVLVPTNCCPVIAGADAETGQYSTLLAEVQKICPPLPCNCPVTPMPACNQGQCGRAVAGGCQGSLDVSEDTGVPHHYGSICAGSWGAMQSTTAVGYIFEGGPAPGVEGLTIDGCVSAAMDSEGITISAKNAMGPGTFMATTSFTDPSAIQWGAPGDSTSITYTTVDPVGGMITGSFKANVSHGGNAAHTLTGTFTVCRVPDELAP